MKKLISLIMCLVLCFTFIVSCEKEEEPLDLSSGASSTEDSTVAEESSSYKGIELDSGYMAPFQPHYYYTTASYPCNPTYLKYGAFVMDNVDELNAELELFSVDASIDSMPYITEEAFNTHYVFLLINYVGEVKNNPTRLIGYRDIFETERGYAIYADLTIDVAYIGIGPDGMAYHGITDNSGLIGDYGSTKTCRFLLVPKGELSKEPVDGELIVYNTVYPIG